MHNWSLNNIAYISSIVMPLHLSCTWLWLHLSAQHNIEGSLDNVQDTQMKSWSSAWTGIGMTIRGMYATTSIGKRSTWHWVDMTQKNFYIKCIFSLLTVLSVIRISKHTYIWLFAYTDHWQANDDRREKHIWQSKLFLLCTLITSHRRMQEHTN